MNDLQIFSNPEFGQVRTVELDGRIDQLKSVAFGLPAYLPYEEHTDRAELHTVRSCGGICRRLCAVCWRRIVI